MECCSGSSDQAMTSVFRFDIDQLSPPAVPVSRAVDDTPVSRAADTVPVTDAASEASHGVVQSAASEYSVYEVVVVTFLTSQLQ